MPPNPARAGLREPRILGQRRFRQKVPILFSFVAANCKHRRFVFLLNRIRSNANRQVNAIANREAEIEAGKSQRWTGAMSDTAAVSLAEREDMADRWLPLTQTLFEHRHFHLFCAYYLVTAWLLLALAIPDAGTVIADGLATGFGADVLMLGVAFLGWLLYFFVATRPERPIAALSEALSARFLNGAALARTLPTFVMISAVIGTFMGLKTQIPRIHPFSYDEPIIQLTSAITGGKFAWQYLLTYFGAPWIIEMLCQVYYLWFPILYGVFVWQLFSTRDDRLRLQFILTIAVCWGLIGSFAALAFSSAGPAFLPALWAKPTPFDGLLQHLEHIREGNHEIVALQVRDTLWQAYVAHSDIGGSGISAMPSMHVTMATVLALFGWRIGRIAGVALTLFAALIFIGSILLGFHYALDGDAGALAAAVIWYLSGHMAKIAYPAPEQSRPR
ncbi:MAG TPA: phosphatase PAP2 family protein [Parvibaculum sp.]